MCNISFPNCLKKNSWFLYFQIYSAKIWRLLQGEDIFHFCLASVWKCIKMHPVTTGHNYSRHGKRSTVSAEDVKLLARRSTALVSSNVLYNGHIQHKTDSLRTQPTHFISTLETYTFHCRQSLMLDLPLFISVQLHTK